MMPARTFAYRESLAHFSLPKKMQPGAQAFCKIAVISDVFDHLNRRADFGI